jgi:hypothetical protein
MKVYEATSFTQNKRNRREFNYQKSFEVARTKFFSLFSFENYFFSFFFFSFKLKKTFNKLFIFMERMYFNTFL